MISIHSSYKIHANTFALIPAKALDYETIILEKDHRLHIRQTPMQIIEESCLKHWTTYEGRRKAVIHHTSFYQKVPMPISIQERIYLFPTHSPKHLDNCWLAYQNILSVHENRHHSSNRLQSIIQFKDGQILKLNVSKHILQTQMNRTFQCMYQLETDKNIYV